MLDLRVKILIAMMVTASLTGLSSFALSYDASSANTPSSGVPMNNNELKSDTQAEKVDLQSSDRLGNLPPQDSEEPNSPILQTSNVQLNTYKNSSEDAAESDNDSGIEEDYSFRKPLHLPSSTPLPSSTLQKTPPTEAFQPERPYLPINSALPYGLNNLQQPPSYRSSTPVITNQTPVRNIINDGSAQPLSATPHNLKNKVGAANATQLSHGFKNGIGNLQMREPNKPILKTRGESQKPQVNDSKSSRAKPLPNGILKNGPLNTATAPTKKVTFALEDLAKPDINPIEPPKNGYTLITGSAGMPKHRDWQSSLKNIQSQAQTYTEEIFKNAPEPAKIAAETIASSVKSAANAITILLSSDSIPLEREITQSRIICRAMINLKIAVEVVEQITNLCTRNANWLPNSTDKDTSPSWIGNHSKFRDAADTFISNLSAMSVSPGTLHSPPKYFPLAGSNAIYLNDQTGSASVLPSYPVFPLPTPHRRIVISRPIQTGLAPTARTLTRMTAATQPQRSLPLETPQPPTSAQTATQTQGESTAPNLLIEEASSNSDKSPTSSAERFDGLAPLNMQTLNTSTPNTSQFHSADPILSPTSQSTNLNSSQLTDGSALSDRTSLPRIAQSQPLSTEPQRLPNDTWMERSVSYGDFPQSIATPLADTHAAANLGKSTKSLPAPSEGSSRRLLSLTDVVSQEYLDKLVSPADNATPPANTFTEFLRPPADGVHANSEAAGTVLLFGEEGVGKTRAVAVLARLLGSGDWREAMRLKVASISNSVLLNADSVKQLEAEWVSEEKLAAAVQMLNAAEEAGETGEASVTGSRERLAEFTTDGPWLPSPRAQSFDIRLKSGSVVTLIDTPGISLDGQSVRDREIIDQVITDVLVVESVRAVCIVIEMDEHGTAQYSRLALIQMLAGLPTDISRNMLFLFVGTKPLPGSLITQASRDIERELKRNYNVSGLDMKCSGFYLNLSAETTATATDEAERFLQTCLALPPFPLQRIANLRLLWKTASQLEHLLFASRAVKEKRRSEEYMSLFYAMMLQATNESLYATVYREANASEESVDKMLAELQKAYPDLFTEAPQDEY